MTHSLWLHHLGLLRAALMAVALLAFAGHGLADDVDAGEADATVEDATAKDAAAEDAAVADAAVDVDTAEVATVSYYSDIRPILQQHCQGCHQPAKASGEFVMISYDALLAAGESGEAGVVPGDPDASELLRQIAPDGDDPPAMPKDRDALTTEQIELVRLWIAEGATDDSPPSTDPVIDTLHPPVYQQPPVITSLAYSPDGTLLAVSAYHEVILFAVDSFTANGGEIVARLVGLSERIESMAFSADGALLAVTGGSPGRFGEVQIWNVASHDLTMSLPVTYDTLYGVAWSPNGKLISFGCVDNTVRAIDAETGEQRLYQGAHSDWVLDTDFSNDSSHLVSVSRDRSMKLTEVATERFIDNITSITPGALKGGLITVQRRPETDELLIGGADGVPKLYQMHRTKKRVIGDDFNQIRVYEGLPGRVFAVEFNGDGSRFVAASSFEGTGAARVYQTEDAKVVSRFAEDRGPIYAAAFRADGAQVAVGGLAGTVTIHNVETGEILSEFMPVPLTAAEPEINDSTTASTDN